MLQVGAMHSRVKDWSVATSDESLVLLQTSETVVSHRFEAVVGTE